MKDQFFIYKNQFLAVYNHFKKLTEKSELNEEQYRNEIKLLLEYFRASYRDSERKTHKIMQLKAELSKYKEKLEDISNEREKDKEIFKEKLIVMKHNLDGFQSEEKHLKEVLEKLKLDVKILRASGISKEQRPETFIHAKELMSPNVLKRDIGVGCDKVMGQSLVDLNQKQNGKLVPQKNNFTHKKFENEIEELKNQMKIKIEEIKFQHTLENILKKRIESRNGEILQLKKQITDLKKPKRKDTRDTSKIISSLQTTINGLREELSSVKDKNKLLEQDIKTLHQEKNFFSLQIQGRENDIGNLKSCIDSLQKSKESATAKATLFENQTKTDKGHLENAKKEIDFLNRTVNKLQSDIQSQASQLTRLEYQHKRFEPLQKIEMLEQIARLEHYKTQVKLRDKRLKSLISELEACRHRLTISRRQFRNKKKQCAALSEELMKWKKAVGIENENLQSLKQKLIAVESANSALKSELKFAKTQYYLIMNEHNKFKEQFKKMNSLQECREEQHRILLKQNEVAVNDLKMRDDQKEMADKKRRQTWAKR
ncbi:uncharacterized protein TNIN_152091 [Trichonephila inaurata madagascariensis]|uniref:Uncharacterized protein n=1 Tax=Trichonephila inaurata madagascariensis TaxID=2747483 RepID=A0A8X6XV92_9ARAC|nr:uncharacterized protein TNIN_152091 [Trichonephila inaurata madagascariensis]